MLKMANPVKIDERSRSKAAETLRLLLAHVPAIRVMALEPNAAMSDRNADFLVSIAVSGRRHTLVCRVKETSQPRHVRMDLLQLRVDMAQQARDTTPVFIAPYLSPQARALCRDHDVGYLDLEGNAHLAFDNVFIDRQVASKPASDRRELKSLFKPKSAQVLRVMLRDPNRAWRVADLAEAAAASLGHVSNVRVGLQDREWAQVSKEGIFLSDPDALLDAWRDAYEPPVGERLSFYTPLHGAVFEEAARQALGSNSQPGGVPSSAFASFSAAHWLSPYARTSTQYFYANDKGLEDLRSALKLSGISKGENVVVTVPRNSDVLHDTEEPAPGALCTSRIQTYLDLAHAGERGREAAEHLRREMLTWPKHPLATPSLPPTTTTARQPPSRQS